MGSERLVSRCRVRKQITAIQPEPVCGPSANALDRRRMVAVAFGDQGVGRSGVFKDKLYLFRRRRPNAGMSSDGAVSGRDYFDANGVSTLGRYYSCRRACRHDGADPGQKRDHHAVSLFLGDGRGRRRVTPPAVGFIVPKTFGVCVRAMWDRPSGHAAGENVPLSHA